MSDQPEPMGFFDDIGEVFSPDAGKEKQQRRWESKVVKTLCKTFNVSTKLLQETAEPGRDDEPLCFSRFVQICPTFPLRLVCRKIHNVYERASIDLLARKFTGTPIYKDFSAAEATWSATGFAGPVGLVFEWLHVWPMAIVHNAPYALSRDGLCLRHWFARNGGQTVCVQDFRGYLESLPWRPR